MAAHAQLIPIPSHYQECCMWVLLNQLDRELKVT